MKKFSEKFHKWAVGIGAFVEVGAIIAFVLSMEQAVYNNAATPRDYIIAGASFVVMMGYTVILGWSMKELNI